MNYDPIISLVNLLFVTAVVPQLIKNYLRKHAADHSYSWHLLTNGGFIVLMWCYMGMDMWWSVSTIALNFILRAILLGQMWYYRES